MSTIKRALQGLQKSFGPREVVSDLSLSVAEGEFVVIVGPEAAGRLPPP